MKLIQFSALLLTMILIVSCNKDLPENLIIKLNDTETFKAGDRYEFKKGDFYIEFKEVTEDSRCPVDAICIWEGFAAATITIHQYRSATDFTIHTIERADMELTTSIEYDNYIIELVQLAPYPGESNYGNDFELDLKISKK